MKTSTVVMFFIGLVAYMSFGFTASLLAQQSQEVRLDAVRERIQDLTGDVRIAQQVIARNSRDIDALSQTVNDLARSINQFTGIGIGLGALGGVIVILQSLSIMKKGKV